MRERGPAATRTGGRRDEVGGVEGKNRVGSQDDLRTRRVRSPSTSREAEA